MNTSASATALCNVRVPLFCLLLPGECNLSQEFICLSARLLRGIIALPPLRVSVRCFGRLHGSHTTCGQNALSRLAVGNGTRMSKRKLESKVWRPTTSPLVPKRTTSPPKQSLRLAPIADKSGSAHISAGDITHN
jgi:hypothetical protein